MYIVVVLLPYRRAQKLEDAADLYIRGGNTYKVAKRPKGVFSSLASSVAHTRIPLPC